MNRREKAIDIKRKLQSCGLYNLPVNIIKFVQANDFKVYKSELPENTTGVLLVDDTQPIENFDTHRLIAVNNKLGYEKSRFIVAHEFAHFVLHKDQNIQIAHRDYSHAREKNEIEADEYAKLLLMPVDLILKNIYNKSDCNYKSQMIDYISDVCSVTKAKASDMISDMISDDYIKFKEDSSLDKDYLKTKIEELERAEEDEQ